MNATPLITAIIPTYQRPKLLRRAIRSVLCQTYENFKICIYDNASSDETASVVDSFARIDQRIVYHRHPNNIGGLPNFVYGMSHVDTTFFSFLPDDDILLPNQFKIALAGFERYPDAMFSATNVIYMDATGRVRGVSNNNWSPGYYEAPAGLLAMFAGGRHPPTWTGILYRREVVDKVGLLDSVLCQADYDLLLRIAARFSFVISKEPGAIFFYHPAGFSSTTDLNFVWPGWLKMISNITDDTRIPAGVRDRAKHLLTEELKRMIHIYGRKAIKDGDFPLAYKAADLLDGYGVRMPAFSLRFWGRFCEVIPLARQALLLYSRVRCALNDRWASSFASQYKSYSQLLSLE